MTAANYLRDARFTDGVSLPRLTAEQVQHMFDTMPSLRVGLLFDLIRVVKGMR